MAEFKIQPKSDYPFYIEADKIIRGSEVTSLKDSNGEDVLVIPNEQLGYIAKKELIKQENNN